MQELINFFSANPWIWIVVGLGVFVLGWLIGLIIGKVAKSKRIKAEEEKAAQEAVRIEEQKRIKEEEAAKAFNERRSVDRSVVESNRRVEGASAVTGKKNY